MALIRIGFFSTVLGMCTSCDVILPQQTDADAPAREFPVMYLLHNLTKSHSTWQRMTCIERYALNHGVAVVMPDAQLSSYADMLHGGRFFTYIADELPGIVHSFFPVSAGARRRSSAAPRWAATARSRSAFAPGTVRRHRQPLVGLHQLSRLHLPPDDRGCRCNTDLRRDGAG